MRTLFTNEQNQRSRGRHGHGGPGHSFADNSFVLSTHDQLINMQVEPRQSARKPMTAVKGRS